MRSAPTTRAEAALLRRVAPEDPAGPSGWPVMLVHDLQYRDQAGPPGLGAGGQAEPGAPGGVGEPGERAEPAEPGATPRVRVSLPPGDRRRRVGFDMAGDGRRRGGLRPRSRPVPGTLDESARRLSHDEFAVAQQLASEGHDVHSLATAPRVAAERRTCWCAEPRWRSSRGSAGRAQAESAGSQVGGQQAAASRGSGATVVLNGQGSGLSEAAARRGVEMYAGGRGGRGPHRGGAGTRRRLRSGVDPAPGSSQAQRATGPGPGGPAGDPERESLVLPRPDRLPQAAITVIGRGGRRPRKLQGRDRHRPRSGCSNWLRCSPNAESDSGPPASPARVAAQLPGAHLPEEAAFDMAELAALAATSRASPAGAEAVGAGAVVWCSGATTGWWCALVRTPTRSFRIRRYGERGMELTRFLPVLESFGLVVVESVPYLIGPGADGQPAVHIDDVGVRIDSPARPRGPAVRPGDPRPPPGRRARGAGARRDRGRLAQPAGDRGRPGLAAGDGAAGLPALLAAGRHRVLGRRPGRSAGDVSRGGPGADRLLPGPLRPRS